MLDIIYYLLNSTFLSLDETVKEVKRQALLEIHQAVSTAEMKANELVNQERLRMENVLSHIKKTAKDEAARVVNKQAESPEVRKIGN